MRLSTDDRPRGVFVTGTDTGVGKTVVSALLLAAASSLGPTYYSKPVQTGDDDDTRTVSALTGLPCVEPAYRLPLPAAPVRAASDAGIELDFQRLLRAARSGEGFAVVEGAGGVLVPLGPGRVIADLISAVALPAVVVASTRLGTLNHTLLTVEALAHRGIPVLGVVLVGPPDPGLAALLDGLLPPGLTVIAEVSPAPALTRPWVTAEGERCFAALLRTWAEA